MVVSMRFYVITIAAIFIALGIGIFIGFNLNGQDILMQQQRLMVEGLEGRFSEIMVEKEFFSDQMNALINENNRNTSFIESLRDAVSSKTLIHENIAMVITNEQYYYTDIKQVLEKAGANIAIEAIYTDKLLTIENKKLQEINSYYGYDIISKDELFSIINHYIVDSIIYGETSIFLNDMIYEGFIRFNGNLKGNNGRAIEKVIVAGGAISQDKVKMNLIDKDLIERVSIYRRRVIGVERLDVGFSYIPLYKTLGISTIDNINTNIGQISLVLLLQGAVGHYGEKNTSDGLFPFFFDTREELTNE